MTESAQYSTSTNLDARIALHRKYTPAGRDMLDEVWRSCRFEPGQRVLDVGCGSGAFWLHPAARGANLDLLMIGASPGMLAAARRNLADSEFTPGFAVGRAEQLPCADDCCDAALAHFMLYHVADKARALGELRRVARQWVGIVLLGAHRMDAHFEVPPSDADRFTAAVARPLIEDAFTRVESLEYAYTMQVTDPEDVLAYALSSDWAKRLDSPFRARYSDAVRARIERDGALAVTKSCTLFLCEP